MVELHAEDHVRLMEATERCYKETVQASATSTRRLVEEHQEVLHHGTGDLIRLRQDNYELQNQVQDLRVNSAVHTLELADISNQLDQLRIVERQLPLQINEQASKVDMEAERLASRSKEVNEQLAQRQEKHSALVHAASMFERRTGLRFEQDEPNLLRIVFTQVQRSAPERQFLFVIEVVKVNDNDVYSVLKTEPALDRRAVDEALDTLNQDPTQFCIFVRAMRKMFAATCAE